MSRTVPIKGIANSRPFDDAFAKVLRIVDEELPSVVDLFQTDSVGALHASDDLEFSAREPAFNLYREGGDFNAHVDRQTLTVLLYLTPPDSCEGGGTGFWSHDTAFGATANPSTDAYKLTYCRPRPAGRYGAALWWPTDACGYAGDFRYARDLSRELQRQASRLAAAGVRMTGTMEPWDLTF